MFCLKKKYQDANRKISFKERKHPVINQLFIKICNHNRRYALSSPRVAANIKELKSDKLLITDWLLGVRKLYSSPIRFPSCFVFFDRALILFNWCVLTRANFNENCTISSKNIELSFYQWFYFKSSVVLLECRFTSCGFQSILEIYFPVSAHMEGGGNECCILSFARFLMSSASDWAARFRLPPVSPDCTILWSPELFFCNFKWMMRLSLAQ